MAQKPMYYNVAPEHVEAFNHSERAELGFVGGSDGKSGYIVTKGRKFGMSSEDVENAIKATGTQTAKTSYYISGVSLTSGSLAITETELPKPTVDTTHNSFVISGTTYTLGVDSDGKISISPYTELHIDSLSMPVPTGSNVTAVLEYGQTESGTLTLTPQNKVSYKISAGTEAIAEGSYMKISRTDSEGTTHTYTIENLTAGSVQNVSIPAGETGKNVCASPVELNYTLSKDATSFNTVKNDAQHVELYIVTDKGQHTQTADVTRKQLSATATIKYRFKYANQNITNEVFTADEDYELYTGADDSLPTTLSLNTGGNYYFAYPATWGTPTLAYKGNTDTNWKLDSTTKFYATEGVEDSGIEYNIYKHQVDQEAGILMEWTITWA